MADPVKILFIADIVGDHGLKVLETFMPSLQERYRPDVVIANAENAHEGRGLNDTILKSLFRIGVDVVTGGNHSFDKHLIFPTMRNEHRLLRPFNYPKGNPGFGFGVYDMRDRDLRFCVMNLIGRTFMAPVNDPFEAADYILRQVEGETPFIFVDMHAEATAEKMAMGWHLDGRVSAVIGTHTHIPSGDARILPGGTGYQTDAGMTGAFHSVLGMDIGTAIRRFTLSTPQRYQLGEGDVRICGTLCTLDGDTGSCIEITPVIHPEFQRRI
jgi:metallophosphoesterase (TIGR00282 family)